jgi:hypothetical protein
MVPRALLALDAMATLPAGTPRALPIVAHLYDTRFCQNHPNYTGFW